MTEEGVYDAGEGPGNDIYYKASLMLHTLRGLVGDDAFFRSIRELVYGTDAPRPGGFQPRYADTGDYEAIVARLTGRDYGWFFDVYLRSAALPALEAVREGGMLDLRWKTEGDRPFPMPVQVRVGDRVVDVPMTGGRGRIPLPAGASFTLDPHSKVLRDLPQVAEYQRDAAERAKAAAADKAKAR
jgi:aminopeptidase N